MMDRRKIVITGAFRFPDRDAAAARVLALGKALRASGHEVVFCGWEAEPRPQDIDAAGGARFQGFEYFPQAEFRTKRLNPVKRLWSYLLAGRNTLKWLRKHRESGIFAVVVYHGRSLFLLRLIRFCRKHGIRLLFDCTEWYGAGQLVGGRFGIDSLDNAFRMRVINPAIKHGFVISNYLRKYYSEHGCNVLRLPPMVDIDEAKWAAPASFASESQELSLVYAGTPGKKDLLDVMLAGMMKALNAGVLVRLMVLGPAKEEVARSLGNEVGVLETLGDKVSFPGRVAQSEVPAALRKADFSVLLRREDRHSRAGFPTKVVESLAAGVPVLCNSTSDLGEFLEDGGEGLFVVEATSDAFADTLIRAAGLTGQQRATMRMKARDRAKEAFDYRQYIGSLHEHLLAIPPSGAGR